MNIGVALNCYQCSGQDGLCSGANDLGTSIACDEGYCTSVQCSKAGKDIIVRTCGSVPVVLDKEMGKEMGIEMSNVTKAEEECYTEVWISSQSHTNVYVD